MKKVPYKIYLSEEEMPREWYNLQADLQARLTPLIHPATGLPCTREDLVPVFCEGLVDQELNRSDRKIEIPEKVREYYRMYRPSPLVRAYALEKALDTPAHIYFKFEGMNTSGSHKLNSAAAQVYYAKEQGITQLTTETGAGQWGTALAMAAAHYGVDLSVYMVRISAEQKPYRKAVMETYGAKVIPSPSDTTEVGRRIRKAHPDTGGSLGCAISEALEVAAKSNNCRYVLGSVLNHVLLHQSIIGMETKAALEKYDIQPDILIGCAGGGSNLGGFIAPYMGERLKGKNGIRFIAVEPASCPSLTRGKFVLDYGDTGKTTPLLKMYTLGNGFIPSSNHSGGLRYHGMSPIVSELRHGGELEARSYEQTEIFEAAVYFARIEGILPAPESAHAIKGAIDEALACRDTGEKKTIVFALTGTGTFDLAAYQAYHAGKMTDLVPTDAELETGFATITEKEKIA